MSAQKKTANEDRFREDPKCRILLGQIVAAGQGLDFCSASLILFVETDWTPGNMDQASDRTSGFNQSNQVLVQYLVWLGSLDEHMIRALADKKKIIDKTIEDDEDFSLLFG